MSEITDPTADPIPTPASSSARPAGLGIRAWALALAVGLLAGVVAWGVGEATLVPEVGFRDKNGTIDVNPSVPATRNGLTSFAALGAAVGLGLGLTGGLVARSATKGVIAGVIGLVVGTAAGGGLAWVILPYYFAQNRVADLTTSLLVHGGVWAGVGAVAGLAFGIGLGGRGALARGLIGGAAGALLAAVIYEFAGGIFFPMALTDRPVSHTWESRLVARLLVTVLVAAGAILAADSTGGRKGTPEAGA